MPTLFIDLDETLVRTLPLNQAEILFGYNVGRDYTKYRQQRAEYRRLIRSFDTGHGQLRELADQRGIKLLSVDGEFYATQLRPQALDFFNIVSELFTELNILTAGENTRQNLVVNALNLRSYFKRIYTMDDINTSILTNKPLATDDFILLDDLYPTSFMWKDKMHALGVFHHDVDLLTFDEQNRFMRLIEKHYVRIPQFLGDLNDQMLVTILPILKEKLSNR